MSFNYWDMKLAGGYVYYDSQVQRIEHLTFNDEKWAADEQTGAFPEEYLPYITFALSKGDEVAFEDLEIKFPDDQWYLTADKKASCLSRRMSRQYKIAPTSDLYDCTIRQGLDVVLPLCDGIKYNTPDDLWNWTLEDKVFNKNICLLRAGRKSRTLMYNSTAIGTMTRGKEWVRLCLDIPDTPMLINKWWGTKLGKKVVAPEDTTVPQGVDFEMLTQQWCKVASPASFQSGIRAFVVHIEALGVEFSIGSNLHLYASRPSDIDLVFMDLQCSSRERQDMQLIFNQEIGDLE